MPTLKELQEQKAALDSQLADAMRQAKIQQIALDLKMEEQRKAERGEALLEIKSLMSRYNLTRFDIFEDLKPEPKAKSLRAKSGTDKSTIVSISDMRRSINNIW